MRAGVNLRELASALDEVAYEIRSVRSGRSTGSRVNAAIASLAEIAAVTTVSPVPPRTRRLRVADVYQPGSEIDLSREHIARTARITALVKRAIAGNEWAAPRVGRVLTLLEKLAAAIQASDADRLRDLKLRQGIPSETLRS